jgi:hypothetical protein
MHDRAWTGFARSIPPSSERSNLCASSNVSHKRPQLWFYREPSDGEIQTNELCQHVQTRLRLEAPEAPEPLGPRSPAARSTAPAAVSRSGPRSPGTWGMSTATRLVIQGPSIGRATGRRQPTTPSAGAEFRSPSSARNPSWSSASRCDARRLGTGRCDRALKSRGRGEGVARRIPPP